MYPLSNVGRTALDALKSKYSASVTGFPLLSSLVGREECAEHVSHHDVENVYRDLLSNMVELAKLSPLLVTRQNRQSPLVNAGYAIRISTVLTAIHEFVCYHQGIGQEGLGHDVCCESASRSAAALQIQIVLLGAGLDVTGIWSMILPKKVKHSKGGPPIALRVIEVDTPAICRVKKAALSNMSSPLIQMNDPPTNAQASNGLVMSAALAATKDIKQPTEYLLLELDLKDSDRVERVLSSWVVEDAPTLVVSELVLSYLGESQVDRVLQLIGAKYIHRVATSAFLAFEPLGPCVSGSNSSCNPPDGVVERYRAAYCRQFNAKLDRGAVQGDEPSIDCPEDDASLHLLGSSCAEVEKRMRRLGYGDAHAALAGVAIRSAFAGHWRSLELFEEHAALALHLRSYVAVCAFGKKSTSLFRQTLCPWISGGCPPATRLLSAEGGTRRAWLAMVELEDEAPIRRIFSESYRDLVDKHASIRKMVRSALASDLSFSPSTAKSSCIHSYYKSRGGFFLVALFAGGGADRPDQRRKILGGIAVRRIGLAELRARNFSHDASAVFEIHRLVVDSSFRRHGVGSLMLQRSKELILWLLCAENPSFQLVATTPALVESANAFYAANGFSLTASEQVGELRMNTHVAACP